MELKGLNFAQPTAELKITKGNQKMTDKEKIMKWFKTHKYLTCCQAIHKLGIYDLRSRVSEMPTVIKDCMVEVVREDGVITRVARYKAIGR